MGDRQEYLALDWVMEELTETLKQAQYALSAYEEDNSNASPLQFCLTYLHQVRGTLDLVEVTGGTLLAQEMESLAAYLVDDPVRASEDRLSLLLKGMLQLSSYLERLQQGGTDQPAVLADLINELRQAREVGPVDEARLFTHDLQAEHDTLNRLVDEAVITSQTQERLHRLRQLFQFALLGLLKEDQPETNLNYLHRACTRVADQLPDSGAGLMWHIAGAVVDAYRNGYLPTGDDPKPTLISLERQLGHQVQAIDRGRSASVPLSLVQQMLYYIARAKPEKRNIADLQVRFGLHDSQRQDQQFATAYQDFHGPDRNTVTSVSRGLLDDLSRVKDELDLFARAGTTHGEPLSGLINPLAQISSTLGLLNIQQGKRVLDEQIHALRGLQAQDPVDQQMVMAVADGLLNVESALVGLEDNQDSDTARREVSAARRTLISEVRYTIEACKEAIDAYIGAQWDQAHLDPLPTWLQQIEANLNIIPLPAPAAVVQALRHFVTEQLLGPDAKQTPDRDSMDRLADALMGVDYYLERLPADDRRAAPASDSLDGARKTLAALGYAADDPASTQELPDPREAVHQTLDDYFDTVGSLDEATIDAAWPSDEEALNSGLMDGPEVVPDEYPANLQTTAQSADSEDTQTANNDAGPSSDAEPGNLMALFLNEAMTSILNAGDTLRKWQASGIESAHLQHLRRDLVTLADAARAIELLPLSALANQLILVYEYLEHHPPSGPDDPAFDILFAAHGAVNDMMDRLAAGQGVQAQPELEQRLAQLADVPVAGPDALDIDAEEKALPAMRSLSGLPADNDHGREPQQTIKVNASLLDNLLNLAGENSLSRARLEEQINDFGATLGELEITIEHLRDRVRQLDRETDAQALFHQEQAEASESENFDPLNMDRYSQMQQLSRSLKESVSDLVDLHNAMTNKSRNAESALQQQSRIHSDLQQGLMQTRMVPFSRLLPRLRRIVRQVCHERDKSAEFHVHNADMQMDHSMLERMVSPLEHMLRDIVDYSLETPDSRTEAGKPLEGEIHLSLAHEENDLVLTLSADGQGIAADSIHRREIEALGGTMDATADPGQGTTLTMRLPFAVASGRQALTQ